MDPKATQNLRLDRRLIRRRGWMSAAQLDKELSALPDVSEKAAEPEGDDEPSDSEPTRAE